MVEKLSEASAKLRPASTNQTGLLVTAELEQALAACKATVERIAMECRNNNKKFRDVEFDLEQDSDRCLYGLDEDGILAPEGIKRVTEIFENPKFYKGNPSSNDIIQGKLGDCWFLSALATMATGPGLIDKVCVARDEEVGVYGFLFFKNDHWVDVIVDDQLYWTLPKYEELKTDEQELYHLDRELYNELATKGGKGLHFARSGTTGETWVPLIEKAYAKLHGDYASLNGGLIGDAIEDLTGGVSTMIKVRDILDTDRFWNDELLHANDKRYLFGVAFSDLSTIRNGNQMTTVQGLFGGHAYSILKAREYRGKRFVVLRNPWGKSEWKGPWSDGSKEWFGEWLDLLKELDHLFGDDGEFVMEYNDFLDVWEWIDRTIIFDSTWIMSSHWTRIPPPPPLPHPLWTYGEITYHFSLSKPSTTVIVLSRLDSRYFVGLDGVFSYNIDFVVYKRGELDSRGRTSFNMFGAKRVSCEIDLEAGEYVVFPRIDRFAGVKPSEYIDGQIQEWNLRKLARVLQKRAESKSIATNYEIGDEKNYLPTLLSTITGSTITEKTLKQDKLEAASAAETTTKVSDVDTIVTTSRTTTVVLVEEVNDVKSSASTPAQNMAPTLSKKYSADPRISASNNVSKSPKGDKSRVISRSDEDESALFLGLQVYTQDGAVVVISSKSGV